VANGPYGLVLVPVHEDRSVVSQSRFAVWPGATVSVVYMPSTWNWRSGPVAVDPPGATFAVTVSDTVPDPSAAEQLIVNVYTAGVAPGFEGSTIW